MRRIQIHLEEEIDDALAREALRRGMSKAALIRHYLSQHVKPNRQRDDPSARLIGIYEGTRNESNRVDEVVYGRALR